MPHSFRILSLFVAIACLVAAGTAIVMVADYVATVSYYGRTAASMAQVVDVNLRRLAKGADVALARWVVRARDISLVATRGAIALLVVVLSGYIDLDGFKGVNDRLGHDRGDEVLVETARAITDGIRAADLSGRIGGDEFVVCLAGSPGTIDQMMREAKARGKNQVIAA